MILHLENLEKEEIIVIGSLLENGIVDIIKTSEEIDNINTIVETSNRWADIVNEIYSQADREGHKETAPIGFKCECCGDHNTEESYEV